MIHLPTSCRLFPWGAFCGQLPGQSVVGEQTELRTRQWRCTGYEAWSSSFLEGRPHEPSCGSTPDLSVLNGREIRYWSKRRTEWRPNRYQLVAHSGFDAFPQFFHGNETTLTRVAGADRPPSLQPQDLVLPRSFLLSATCYTTMAYTEVLNSALKNGKTRARHTPLRPPRSRESGRSAASSDAA